MARDDTSPSRDPESKRSGGAPPRQERVNAWTQRRGRSGYGTESIRPHLRAQLEQQKLMRPTFPPEVPEDDTPPKRRGRA